MRLIFREISKYKNIKNVKILRSRKYHHIWDLRQVQSLPANLRKIETVVSGIWNIPGEIVATLFFLNSSRLVPEKSPLIVGHLSALYYDSARPSKVDLQTE